MNTRLLRFHVPTGFATIGVTLSAVALAAGTTVLVASPSSLGEMLRSTITQPQGDTRNAIDVAAGDVPDGVTVFDDTPAVTKLRARLLSALRTAATDAASEGIIFIVNSGWRSPEFQQRLFDDAVSRYGSRAEAARWVAPAQTSEHVSGRAVDIGPTDASSWLDTHGSAYSLCRRYDNEIWHYEYVAGAEVVGCPRRYPDAAHDPRYGDAAR